VVERVEEYRYFSSPGGDLRELPIGVLTLRIGTFHKVHKRVTTPAKGPPGTAPKLGRRLR
jgi:hypothetical protein